MIVGSESLRYFKAMLYGFNQSPQHQSAKIYESAGRVVEEIIPEELMTELQQLIIISKAEEHGFLYDEKKNAYTFNANVFAKQFISRCHVRSTKDGRLFLYHRKGVF
ncbi:DNA primase family protein, partial [Bacillus cereus group sp. Bce025]